MTAAERLLARLSGVRSSAPGRWVARCPAHSDRSPSLSIRELEDGRVLIHCFGGCETAAVMTSLNLEVSDLFEHPRDHRRAPPRDRTHWHAVRGALEELRSEARILVIVASDCVANRSISDVDADRVARAAGNIVTAVEVLYGR